jgi:Family of unknown function (DUF5946)
MGIFEYMTDQEAYHEISYYTLAHKEPTFVHQYIVDAYAAQHADEHSKPIYLAFALAGLYLHNEKHFTGKHVQLAHMQLGKEKKPLPKFDIPENKGMVTVRDVLKTPPGPDRDEAIEKWSASAWQAYSASRDKVAQWIKEELNI